MVRALIALALVAAAFAAEPVAGAQQPAAAAVHSPAAIAEEGARRRKAVDEWELAAIREWAAREKPSKIPEVNVGPDPRPSEVEHAQEIQRANGAVDRLLTAIALPRSAENDRAVLGAFHDLAGGVPVKWERYCELAGRTAAR